tara:strand:- start:426 stop:821 length:396 start_codon:yes stop_codon:yes gene_type:complete
MPEITAWCNTRKIRKHSPVGALPQGACPAEVMRINAVTAFEEGAYSLHKVRFLGYFEYGTDAENVPPLMLSATLFYQEGMTNELLRSWAQRLAEKTGDKFDGLHVIVKIIAGNCSGFGEVNRPKELFSQRN